MRLLFLVFFYIATLSAQDAFYAISSLRYFIEQNDHSDITFDERDIALLWEKAATCQKEEVEIARELYYQSNNKLEAGKVLEGLWCELQVDEPLEKGLAYPHFHDNPYVLSDMRKKITPYLLPENHPIKPVLDAIFLTSRATKDIENFTLAGFITRVYAHNSYLHVAEHPSISGYLLKIYLDSETKKKNGNQGWELLTNRCEGAKNVRKLIQKKGFKHFVVPDKWLYPLPARPEAGVIRHPVILLVTDMEITTLTECERAWKTRATKELLDELFCILSHGYASAHLISNVAYTKQGKFAFIDTEYPKRKIDYGMARPFLSKEMQEYWDKLVRNGG